MRNGLSIVAARISVLLKMGAYRRHPSAQSRAWATKAEAKMARELTSGKAQPVSREDFNERVKRLLADKPDPRKAEVRAKNFKGSTPFVKG